MSARRNEWPVLSPSETLSALVAAAKPAELRILAGELAHALGIVLARTATATTTPPPSPRAPSSEAEGGTLLTVEEAGVGRAINDNERKAIAVLDDRLEPGTRFSNSLWLKESGISSDDTFRSVKDRLLDAGLAVAEPTDRLKRNGKTQIRDYGITDRGRKALNTSWTIEGVKP